MINNRIRPQAYFPITVVLVWFLSLYYVPRPELVHWLRALPLALIIVAQAPRRWRTRALKLPVLAAMLGYMGLVMGTLFANDALPLPRSFYTAEFLFQIVSPILLYGFVRLYPIDRPQLKLMAYAFIAVIITQSFLGPISLRYPLRMPSIWTPRPGIQYRRGTGTLRAPEAYVLALLFGMALVFLQHLRQPRRVYWGALAVGVGGIAVSMNRTGWFNALLLLGIISIFERALIKWVALGAVAAAIMALVLAPGALRDGLDRLRDSSPVESRIILNLSGLRMAAEKPLIGWGYASYDLHDWKFMQPVGDIVPRRFELATGTSHNTYLTILAETGVVGLALYLFPTAYWLARTVWAARRNRLADPALLVMMWAVVLIIHVAAQVADMRFFPEALGAWWFALAVIANELADKP